MPLRRRVANLDRTGVEFDAAWKVSAIFNPVEAFEDRLIDFMVPHERLSKLWSPFGSPNSRCRTILRTQKGSIILTTTIE